MHCVIVQKDKISAKCNCNDVNVFEMLSSHFLKLKKFASASTFSL